jgi:Fur family ferric uptake transcriptional regulator
MHISADQLLDALRAEGLRITSARRAVCEVIATSHGNHLTAQAIHDVVKDEQKADVDRSTVYRTLEALESAGILEHSHLGQGASVYHLTSEPRHQHLICSRCGATKSLAADDLKAVIDEIQRRTGFVPDPHVALTGLCARCAKATGA